MNLIQRFFASANSEFQLPQEKTRPAANEYFLLECWNQYSDLSESLLPYVDYIKTREEWEKLGFVLETNRLGQIRKIKYGNHYISFIKVSALNPVEALAIKTGKRLTQNKNQIRLLLERGCRPDEFMMAV